MSDSLRPHGLYSLPGSSIHGIFQEYWSGLPCYQRPLKVIGHVIPFSSVQLLSRVQLFVTPWTSAHQASLSSTISWSLLKLMSIKLVMTSNCLILCRPILLLPSIFPSIRVFSNGSVLLIRWLKYWSFSFSISPSNEYSGIEYSGLTGLISLQSKGISNTTVEKH